MRLLRSRMLPGEACITRLQPLPVYVCLVSLCSREMWKGRITAMVVAITASMLGCMMRGSPDIAAFNRGMNFLARPENRSARDGFLSSSLYAMQSSNITPKTSTRLTGLQSRGRSNTSSHRCINSSEVSAGKYMKSRLPVVGNLSVELQHDMEISSQNPHRRLLLGCRISRLAKTRESCCPSSPRELCRGLRSEASR